MARLVVVSNRVGDPRKPGAGGLAVALGDALRNSGGLWFGWSGVIDNDTSLHTHRAGETTLATINLSPDEHQDYYLDYSNAVLWPVFHYRVDLADFESADVEGYRRVNRRMAHQLQALLRPDDLIWVHDYHLIPIAAELRAMGCEQRIGFFLHIPLPPRPILATIPHHGWLMRSLFSYDLVGFQSPTDLRHFADYVRDEISGGQIEADRYRGWDRTLVARALPIGIDVDEFQALGDGADARAMFATLREQYPSQQLLAGVDRLDYSKGLPQRLIAFRKLLEHYPENRGHTTLIQIAAPSRERVDAFVDIRGELESLCGSINGEYGELEWQPVRYMRRSVARRRLPGLYRASRVGLVTPLRDGMNLVAKEYIVAQDPEDPGVLVLSRFAGAAKQLDGALLVNPYDSAGTAETIQQALQMPLEERRERHRGLMALLREFDVHWWHREFMRSLAHDAG